MPVRGPCRMLQPLLSGRSQLAPHCIELQHPDNFSAQKLPRLPSWELHENAPCRVIEATQHRKETPQLAFTLEQRERRKPRDQHWTTVDHGLAPHTNHCGPWVRCADRLGLGHMPGAGREVGPLKPPGLRLG